MAVIDCFTFNGEYDLLEIRLNVLNEYVDQFVIVESPTTFSGFKKPLYFKMKQARYKKWAKKIKYFVIDENFTDEEMKQALESPNTKGALHWTIEFLQKESIKKALTHLKDSDMCFIGDVDEIWNPEMTHPQIGKMKLLVYTYYLNNRSNEEFWGTLVAPYKFIKDTTLNHLRTRTDLRMLDISGWHFTSMGGLLEVRRKLNDSYTVESYNTYEVQELLSTRFRANQDYIGRDFVFWTDEKDWPQYLKDNRKKYAHLCR